MPSYTGAERVLGQADKIRALAPGGERLIGLFNEESELADVPEAQFGDAEKRCHEAREDVLCGIDFDHGPYKDPLAFF